MSCDKLLVSNLLDLTKTDAASIFDGVTYPFEVLPLIGKYITDTLIPSLDKEKFEEKGENVWIAKSATVAPSALINGPCVIFDDAEIRHCAFIRGNAIVGRGSVVGNSTELKNCIIFDSVQVPHYNYVGDSVLGYKSHMGAGSITANIKADKSNITVRIGDEAIPTGLRKMGGILGDYADVGCNSVITPGSVIARKSNVYPLSFVRGYIPENSIYKNKNEVVEKYNID